MLRIREGSWRCWGINEKYVAVGGEKDGSWKTTSHTAGLQPKIFPTRVADLSHAVLFLTTYGIKINTSIPLLLSPFSDRKKIDSIKLELS